MKYIKNNYIYLCFAIAIALFQVSCDSNDDLNLTVSKAYINTEIYPVNTVEIDLVHTPTSVIPQSETTVKFPIRLTHASSSQVKVKVVVDNTLVETYNTEKKTSFIEIPATGYKLVVAEVTIKEGEIISADSISFSLSDFASLKDQNGYMVPLKIAEVITNDKGVEISSNMMVVYVTVNNSFVNIDLTATTIEGTAIDKSNWTAVASVTYAAAYGASNAIDGKNSTSWFAQTASKPMLTVNMGSEQELKGFRICPNYSAFASSYAIKKIEVLVSNDGVKWTSQGVSPVFSLPTGNVNAPDYKIIKFYGPVKATYFRFVLVENHTSYAGIGEIDAIK